MCRQGILGWASLDHGGEAVGTACPYRATTCGRCPFQLTRSWSTDKKHILVSQFQQNSDTLNTTSGCVKTKTTNTSLWLKYNRLTFQPKPKQEKTGGTRDVRGLTEQMHISGEQRLWQWRRRSVLINRQSEINRNFASRLLLRCLGQTFLRLLLRHCQKNVQTNPLPLFWLVTFHHGFSAPT